MSFWTDVYVRREQIIDHRQEAERHRLISRVRSSTRNHTTGFDRTMVSAGRRLIDWGCRLEAHYN